MNDLALAQNLRDRAALFVGGVENPDREALCEAADRVDALRVEVDRLLLVEQAHGQSAAQIAGLLAELEAARADLVVARTPIALSPQPAGGQETD